MYVWQSDCSGFGKRPDVEHTKKGSEVVGSSSVVVTAGVVLGFEVVVGSIDGSGVVVIGSEVIAGSVEDSIVVDATGPGQIYSDADTHFCINSSNTVVPGHFVCVATKVPSVVHAQL